MQSNIRSLVVNSHNSDFQLFWCWRRNIVALVVNTMPADALGPNVANASANMVLAV